MTQCCFTGWAGLFVNQALRLPEVWTEPGMLFPPVDEEICTTLMIMRVVQISSSNFCQECKNFKLFIKDRSSTLTFP